MLHGASPDEYLWPVGHRIAWTTPYVGVFELSISGGEHPWPHRIQHDSYQVFYESSLKKNP